MSILSKRWLPLTALVIAVVVFCTQTLAHPCACTEGGSCFCMQSGETLRVIDDAELSSRSPADQAEYRAFIEAWQQEYEAKTQEWTRMYAEFHGGSHSAAEKRDFNRELAKAHRDFLALFHARDSLFRERLGLQP